MVKIRLQRKGRRKQPFYHIVVADARAPRDGRFIEKLGYYNPMTAPATIELDRDKAYEWLTKGAQPTETMRAILRFKGVLYRKHLMRGVKKGAMNEDKAMELYNDFITEKDAKIAQRFEEEAGKKLARLAEISGVAPPPPAPPVEEVVEEAPAAADAAEAAVEEVVEAPAEAAAEVTEAAETAVEEVVEAPAEAAAEAKEEVAEAAAEVTEEVKAEDTPADA